MTMRLVSTAFEIWSNSEDQSTPKRSRRVCELCQIVWNLAV
jgi:hypothetical protein